MNVHRCGRKAVALPSGKRRQETGPGRPAQHLKPRLVTGPPRRRKWWCALVALASLQPGCDAKAGAGGEIPKRFPVVHVDVSIQNRYWSMPRFQGLSMRQSRGRPRHGDRLPGQGRRHRRLAGPCDWRFALRAWLARGRSPSAPEHSKRGRLGRCRRYRPVAVLTVSTPASVTRPADARQRWSSGA